MPHSGLVGKIIEYDGRVCDVETGIDYTYHGLLALEEADGNERGSWINAVLLPVKDDDNPRWVTLDSDFSYGRAIYVQGKILPDLSGIAWALDEEAFGAYSWLEWKFEVWFGIYNL